MSILITTPTQLDALIDDAETFILQQAVTNIPDYNEVTLPELTNFSYYLCDRAFRSVPIEGSLMLFKKRHGIILPVESFFYVVDDGKTPFESFTDWCNNNSENTTRFILNHLAYYHNYNDGLFYRFYNNSDNLVEIPLMV